MPRGQAVTQPAVVVNTGLIGIFIDIAKTWGIFAALTVVFVWQSDVRERSLNERLDKQREFVETKLMETINQNTSVVKAATIALDSVANRVEVNAQKVEAIDQRQKATSPQERKE